MVQKSYNQMFAKYAEQMQSDFEAKLERELTAEEVNALRNAGSLMMLESVDQGLYYAKSKSDAEKALKECFGLESRFVDGFKELIERIQKRLKRELNEQEINKLKVLPNLYEINCVIELLETRKKKIKSVEELLNIKD